MHLAHLQCDVTYKSLCVTSHTLSTNLTEQYQNLTYYIKGSWDVKFRTTPYNLIQQVIKINLIHFNPKEAVKVQKFFQGFINHISSLWSKLINPYNLIPLIMLILMLRLLH
jgi:hypothetical protein